MYYIIAREVIYLINLVLIKVFDKEEYADSFIEKGEMKFTSTIKFWEYPDENYRRDRNEGLIRDRIKIPKEHSNSKISIPGMYGKVYEIDGLINEVREEIKSKTGEDVTVTHHGDLEVQIDYYTKSFIYSTFLVDSNFLSNNNLFQTLSSLGDYCVLFHGEIIINELRSFIENKCVKFEHGPVRYVNDEYFAKERISSYNKHEMYKNQNEYRITFLPKEDYPELEYVFVSLGNISKIAKKFTVEQFIDVMKETTQQVVNGLREKNKII